MACNFPEIARDELVYENDFEDSNLLNISGGGIMLFNNTNVLGNFNNDGFTLHLDELENHDYVFVSFDLYIHGTCDGNTNGFEFDRDGFKDKPDKWIMELRPYMDLHQDSDFQKFETTFSNSPCFSNWCRRQSYPNSFPFENNPYSGASQMGLEKTCDGNWGGPSALYKIEKGFRHSGNALIIRFYDELFQPNAIDNNGNSSEKCDESWSMDNLKVRIISYK